MSQLAVTDRPPQRAVGTRQVPVQARPPEAEVRRIIAGAWAVLERSRFRSLKIRQVLVASDTSASNFYRHFPSKSHLLLALLEDETARADQLLLARLDGLASADDELREWLAFTIRAVYDGRRADRARMFLDQDLQEELPDDVVRLQSIMVGRLVEIIRRGVAKGRFRSADPVADAAMIQYMVRGLLANGLIGQLTGSAEETLAVAHDFTLRALGAEARQAVVPP